MCERINDTFAFIFDSGKFNSCSYGEIVFDSILKGKELYQNKTRMMIFEGDILFNTKYIDIEPYISNDDFCSIDFNNLKSFKDYPYCWVIHNLSYDIALLIDKRLKNELTDSYIGLSKIDLTSKDERKQFWKNLVYSFDLYKNKIFCFYDPNLEGTFKYSYKSNDLRFNIEYELFEKPLLSTYIKNKIENKIANKIDCIDRDIWQLNFMLGREIQVAGALIWKSVNDIDKVNFFSLFPDKNIPAYLIEYSFFTLYHAAQGIERIQKIVVELICKKQHIKTDEKEKVFEILHSHNHTALNNWIKDKEKIYIKTNGNKLLEILQSFYNQLRYYRYEDKQISETTTPEFDLLLKLKSSNDINKFNDEIKNNFGRMLGQLVNSYFELFRNLCDDLKIYAYELEPESSAYYAFYCECDDNNLYEVLLRKKRDKKELIYWLIKNGNKIEKYKKLKLKALDFDESMIDDYVTELIEKSEDGSLIHNFVDEQYDELCYNNKDSFLKRLQAIDLIVANPEYPPIEDTEE